MPEKILEENVPQSITDVQTIVRTWYGNLPVEVLVLNKRLQQAILDFEKMCERGSFDFVSFTEDPFVLGAVE